MFGNNRWKLNSNNSNQQKPSLSASQENLENFTTEIKDSASLNVNNIQQMLHSPPDFKYRIFPIGQTGLQAAITFIDGLVESKTISEDITEKILNKNLQTNSNPEPASIITKIKNEIVTTTQSIEVHTLDDVMLDVLSGNTAFFLDGIKSAIILPTAGMKTRAIAEPESESVVRGPRDGFIENIQTNLMLIRRHIRDANLRYDHYKIGRRGKRSLIVSYIDGIANPSLINEVKRRIESIDIDDAPDTGVIEQWIEDSFLSPFPQVINTERPDRTSTALLQGKIAILLDGTPFALILPVTLGQMFQSPEDNYERWMVSSLLRILRYVAAFIAMFLPALYIALVSYHPGMIPTKLAFSITATREGVPVPAVIEAMMMEATMELLREAGIRLPKSIGQTIGIVGGLVIGEAAVAAGIVSPIMVIIVSLTAISSFSIPSYSTSIALRFLRFHFMIGAALFGLYGIIIGYIMINIHIANLKSFGIPYSTPFAPTLFKDWKDLIIRIPHPMNMKRTVMLQTKDITHASKGEKNKE